MLTRKKSCSQMTTATAAPFFLLFPFIIIFLFTLIATASSMMQHQQQHQQQRRRTYSNVSNFGTIEEETDQIVVENEQQSAGLSNKHSSPIKYHSGPLSFAEHNKRRIPSSPDFSVMGRSGEIVVVEDDDGNPMRPLWLQIPEGKGRLRKVHHHNSYSQELVNSPSSPMYNSGELLQHIPYSGPLLVPSKRNNNNKQLHRRNSSLVTAAAAIQGLATSVKNTLLDKCRPFIKEGNFTKNKEKTERKKPAKKPFNCNNAWWKLQMSRMYYWSSTEQGEIKWLSVALGEEPLGSGVQAELYHGCVKKDRVATHVGIKLVGLGTQQQNQSPKQKQSPPTVNSPHRQKLLKLLKQSPSASNRSPTIDEVLLDPQNEVKMLRLFQDDKIVHNEEQRKHIIRLFDSGMIEKIQHPGTKKGYHELQSTEKFNFVEILELGGDNLMETFIATGKDGPEPEEVLMDILLEPAQAVVQVHQVVIHMDIKPQNFIFVDLPKEVAKKSLKRLASMVSFVFGNKSKSKESKEKSSGEKKSAENNVLKENKKKTQILKAIDFGGSVPLPGLVPNSPSPKNLKKITSSKVYLSLELDGIHLLHDRPKKLQGNRPFRLAASTKTDMWMFGMMAYHLVLFNMHPEQECLEADERIDQMKILVGRINKAYKIINDFTKSDFLTAKQLEEEKRKSEQSEEKKQEMKQGEEEKQKTKQEEEVKQKTKEKEEEDAKIDVSNWPKLKEFIQDKFYFDFEELLLIILRVKKEFPRLFLMISHLLLRNADDRLSAQGVVDFLSEKCKLTFASTLVFWFEPKYVIGPLTTEVLENMDGLSAELKKESTEAANSVQKSLELWKMKKLPECDRNYQPREEKMGEA